MAKQAAVAAQAGPVKRLQNFIQEVRSEMSKVTWPTVEDLKVSTKVTLLLLVIMAAIIFVYDKIFEIIMVTLLGLLTS